MQKMAKIYQKRHQHTVNGVVVNDVIHYKIIFSEPSEMKAFEKQVKLDGGRYNFDKDQSIQKGKLPKMSGMKEGDYCWCDYTTNYLLNAGYEFKESTNPYKCEIYLKP